MIELLKLSESKAALVGGVAVDTLCLGVLVLWMLEPSIFAQGHAGVIMLIAVAITGPVLASASVMLSIVLSGRFDMEERARRTIMAASVLHGGVQLSTVLGIMCGRGPATISAYFLSTLFLTVMLSGSLLIVAWLVRKLGRSGVRATKDPGPPPARL